MRESINVLRFYIFLFIVYKLYVQLFITNIVFVLICYDITYNSHQGKAEEMEIAIKTNQILNDPTQNRN